MPRPPLLPLLAGIAFVTSQANLVSILLPLQPSVFALQLAFTARDFWHVVELWGDAGLAIYRSHFVFDNLHPFIYGVFGYCLIARTSLFPRTHTVLRRLLLLALPIAGAFDLGENAGHLHLLSHQPGTADFLIPLAATCSAIKWSLACLFAVGVAIQVCRLMATICCGREAKRRE